MIETVVSSKSFQWLDLVAPTREELEQVATQYGLHPTSVQDCLDPHHLPKFERIGTMGFVILRAWDENSTPDADTIQELTRKIAIFFDGHVLLTLHRKDQPYIVRFRETWRQKALELDDPSSTLLEDLLLAALMTFEHPIETALSHLETLEMNVFGVDHKKPFKIKQGYFLKRQSSVYKRILRVSLDLLPKIRSSLDQHNPQYQNLKEQTDSLLFYADELVESVQALLSLHISLVSQKTNEASHRTNEVMRILTIFSLFLLPLNVITGIYGMNFEHMPELKWPWGYPAALLAMAGTVFFVFFWFRKKGWLK